jgi:tetratricopeptide (TPR) repeat protein
LACRVGCGPSARSRGQPTNINLLRVYARELAAARDSDDGEDGQRAALTRLFDHYLHAAATAMDTLFPAERHRRPRVPPPRSQVQSVAVLGPARERLDAERANLTAVAAQAAGQFRQALALFREIGDRADEAEILNGLGEIFLATGHPAQARAHHAYALSLARQVGDQVQQARACDGLGRACHAGGDPARARRHWQEALALYTSLGTPEADQIRAQLATDCAC